MCLICVDLIKGSLTTAEAFRNLKEFKETSFIDAEHYEEVEDLIVELDPEPFDPFW